MLIGGAPKMVALLFKVPRSIIKHRITSLLMEEKNLCAMAEGTPVLRLCTFGLCAL